ncbi:MAG: fasciclin domain-containing protein [Prevotella sp.]|nr:fasciclin domain-containing protein [Prevotella sp.]
MRIFKRNITLHSPSNTAGAGKGLRRGAMLLAATAALAGFSACSDWDDHYDNTGVEGSSTTLWEQITARPELSDFAEVLTSTKVFRQHKKTSVSYADLLNGGQSLTLFAPLNGTFNKDSLIALTETAQGDSAVEVFFVKNHLAGTLRSAADTTNNFRLLNGKHCFIQRDNAAGVPLEDSNVRSKNGIMHVLKTQMPYTFTIYESLTMLPEFEEAGTAIKRYNEDYFNADASVSSGLVDGIPVYVDSVIYERNKLLEAVGAFKSEDSTFYVAVPTNAGWQAAWEKASSYFKYSSALEKCDSLQHYWTSRALYDDAVFSKTIQASMNDSVITYRYDASYPEYHVYYRPFDSDGLFGRANGMRKCSNGFLYYYDEWPFTPTQTYFRKIEQEAEYTWNIMKYDKCTHNVRALNADSISKGAYLDIVATSGTANWSVTYKLSNTLSGSYDFCAVVLPKTVEGPNGNMRPCKFKATINYIDEDGTPQTYDCGGKTFTTDPARVDTVMLAEDFKLPACNYDQNNEKVSVTITCSITNKESARYNREMYLDCIFLRPKDK